MGNINNAENRICGVCCKVKDCAYHGKGDCCSAGEITVCPDSGAQQTNCKTYKRV